MCLEMLDYLTTLHKGIITLEMMVGELTRAAELAPEEAARLPCWLSAMVSFPPAL